MTPVVPATYDPIRRWARETPHAMALVDRARGVRLDYAALDLAADQWAAWMHEAGVRVGDRVAVLAGNRHEIITLFFACARLGTALVPLNWRLTSAELAPLVADASAALLVTDARFRDTARELCPLSTPLLDLDGPDALAIARAEPDASCHGDVDADTPLLILYTSGTTGRAKGAVLPHRQLVHNAIATTTAWRLDETDIVPVSTPLFHTGGWNVFATPIWFVGGTVILFDGFDPGDFLAGMAAERCTVAFGVPTQLVMLLEHPLWHDALPALRGWISGGAPCPAPVAARVRASGYPFREGYGLTECGPNCFTITDAESASRPGVVGWPVPFLEMRLIGPDGDEVADDEVGELLLRGPQRFTGYLHDPARTAEALAADGWLRTGDLGRRHEDGAYAIVGRRKEMFISGGENVYPAEVEAALADCPGVAEVVVVGVPHARWGEVGCAFVQPHPGARFDDTALLLHARQRLAGYKVPKSVVILDALPRLGSGKPDRRQLTRIAAEPNAASRHALVD